MGVLIECLDSECNCGSSRDWILNETVWLFTDEIVIFWLYSLKRIPYLWDWVYIDRETVFEH